MPVVVTCYCGGLEASTSWSCHSVGGSTQNLREARTQSPAGKHYSCFLLLLLFLICWCLWIYFLLILPFFDFVFLLCAHTCLVRVLYFVFLLQSSVSVSGTAPLQVRSSNTLISQIIAEITSVQLVQITQNALKASESLLCLSWTIYKRRRSYPTDTSDCACVCACMHTWGGGGGCALVFCHDVWFFVLCILMG